jgi:UDP-N-acetylmuramoyl-tripeptide--D-alanyl-D-alanine ligase
MRSVDEVAAEHADAIRALPAGGTAVLNADDPHVAYWREAAAEHPRRRRHVRHGARADVTARYVAHPDGASLDVTTPGGNARFLLQVPGRHMAGNALAAAAAAHAAGLPVTAITLGLERFARFAAAWSPCPRARVRR